MQKAGVRVTLGPIRAHGAHRSHATLRPTPERAPCGMASEGCSSDQRLTKGQRQSGRRTSLRKTRPRAIIRVVTRIVHVPYVVEQDEDGVWCASAQLRPGVAAFGDGPTQEAAIADLCEGLELLIEEVGPPDELTLTLDVA